MGVHIVNGGIEDDAEGRFTYIGGGGTSVIDYVFTNEEGREYIRKMEVEDTLQPDHMPIQIKLEIEFSKKEGEQGVEEKEYIDWSEEATKRYREKWRN